MEIREWASETPTCVSRTPPHIILVGWLTKGIFSSSHTHTHTPPCYFSHIIKSPLSPHPTLLPLPFPYSFWVFKSADKSSLDCRTLNGISYVQALALAYFQSSFLKQIFHSRLCMWQHLMTQNFMPRNQKGITGSSFRLEKLYIYIYQMALALNTSCHGAKASMSGHRYPDGD